MPLSGWMCLACAEPWAWSLSSQREREREGEVEEKKKGRRAGRNKG